MRNYGVADIAVTKYKVISRVNKHQKLIPCHKSFIKHRFVLLLIASLKLGIFIAT